jgi:hypothetical protein
MVDICLKILPIYLKLAVFEDADSESKVEISKNQMVDIFLKILPI